MATAPAPATSRTMWRSGSRQESVASRNSSIPPSSTHAIGTSALISQLIRSQGRSGSPLCRAPTSPSDDVLSAGSPTSPVLNELFRARAGFTGSSGSRFRPGFVICFAALSIRVQSVQQVRYSEEGEHNHPESQDCEVCGPAATPAAGNPHVQVSGIHQPRDRRPRLFGIPVPVRTPGAVGPVGAGGDHQGEQGEGNANRFVRDAVERIGIGQKALQICASPQQQQIKQIGEDPSDEAREDEWACPESSWVQTFGVKRRVKAATNPENEEQQRQRLEQDTDKDRAVGDTDEDLILLHSGEDGKRQGCKHGCEYQQHQPAEIRNCYEQTNTLRDENFRFVLRIPCDHVETAPTLKAGEDRGINSHGERRRPNQEAFGLHLVLD